MLGWVSSERGNSRSEKPLSYLFSKSSFLLLITWVRCVPITEAVISGVFGKKLKYVVHVAVILIPFKI